MQRAAAAGVVRNAARALGQRGSGIAYFTRTGTASQLAVLPRAFALGQSPGIPITAECLVHRVGTTGARALCSNPEQKQPKDGGEGDDSKNLCLLIPTVFHFCT